MSLSNKTIQNLSIVMTSDVINAIMKDERYAEFMLQIIPEYVTKYLQSQDDTLIGEISCCIMDNIMVRPFKTL